MSENINNRSNFNPSLSNAEKPDIQRNNVRYYHIRYEFSNKIDFNEFLVRCSQDLVIFQTIAYIIHF